MTLYGWRFANKNDCPVTNGKELPGGKSTWDFLFGGVGGVKGALSIVGSIYDMRATAYLFQDVCWQPYCSRL